MIDRVYTNASIKCIFIAYATFKVKCELYPIIFPFLFSTETQYEDFILFDSILFFYLVSLENIYI